METKLRNLKFAKDVNIDLFANMFKTTAKDFYSLQGDTSNAVNVIVINHEINTLSKETRSRVTILQLTGNKNL